MTTIQEIRAQHPPFLRTVWADARITAAYRKERYEFRSHLDGALQVLRLMLVTDAFAAQVCYRAKAALQRRGVIIVPRILHRLAMMLADVAIGDPVHVEPGVYIVHGQVVIDGYTRIGSGSLLFPWITIGLRASNFQGPDVRPGCSIYTGAKVIGPVTVGPNASVGANAVVVDDVPEGVTVVGMPARPVGTATGDQRRLAMSRADRLADEGRWHDAVQTLSELNSVDPSPEVEHAIVQIRHRAAATDTPVGPADWPPSFADRFAGEQGIPAITPDELDAEALRAGVLGHGALIVRGLFRNEAPDLRRWIDLAYAGQDRWLEHGPGNGVDPWYHEFRSYVDDDRHQLSRFGRAWHRNTGAVLVADSPRGLFHLVSTFERHGIPTLMEAYLGERAALSVEKTGFRRVVPDVKGGWHQDGAFLGADIRSMNLWIAASDCGAEAPTMELVSHRLDRIVETGTGDAPFDWAVGEEAAARAAGPGGMERPHFQAGDAVFFDHMNLHRTSGGPGMVRERYAIESWWFAASHYPEGSLPLWV